MTIRQYSQYINGHLHKRLQKNLKFLFKGYFFLNHDLRYLNKLKTDA